ncbi:PadR family transcriptional regulator [Ekhidna sp. MALMAid0563]|uniref:PadR family transcriptional regulator n=1 Tax=Ekhidna sp. MALMAid0563 TaxID=3143937 RepID=UPI0032E0109F
MKGKNLGEFEELVMLAVGILHDDAHGISVQKELGIQSGRKPMISAVHKVLVRLEDKGYLQSQMGGATSERGGRKKRLYEITAAGKKALATSKELRNKMWDAVPQVVWGGGSS